jgi:transposase-like protein
VNTGASLFVSRSRISLQERRTEMTEQEQKKYAVPLMRSYSEEFKRKVVMEVENELLTKDGAKYRYGIVGNSCVLDWCRKYGRLQHPKTQTRTIHMRRMKTEDDPRYSKHRSLHRGGLQLQATSLVAGLSATRGV